MCLLKMPADQSGLSPQALRAADRLTGTVKPIDVITPAVITPEIMEMKSAIIAMAKEINALRSEVEVLRKVRQPATDFSSWYASFFERPPARLETTRDRYNFQPLMLDY
ncbi:MAG: hypothetical protein HQM09_20610 [Candidatus Riflebacteria bacterium]|nr:hypothetical protein [Candidatus Riflebacteria bacterium]